MIMGSIGTVVASLPATMGCFAEAQGPDSSMCLFSDSFRGTPWTWLLILAPFVMAVIGIRYERFVVPDWEGGRRKESKRAHNVAMSWGGAALVSPVVLFGLVAATISSSGA